MDFVVAALDKLTCSQTGWSWLARHRIFLYPEGAWLEEPSLSPCSPGSWGEPFYLSSVEIIVSLVVRDNQS